MSVFNLSALGGCCVRIRDVEMGGCCVGQVEQLLGAGRGDDGAVTSFENAGMVDWSVA